MQGCHAHLASAHVGRFRKIPFTFYLHIKDIVPLNTFLYAYNNILSILNIFGNSVTLCSCRVLHLHQIQTNLFSQYIFYMLSYVVNTYKTAGKTYLIKIDEDEYTPNKNTGQ